jgi:hypothetical protein
MTQRWPERLVVWAHYLSSFPSVVTRHRLSTVVLVVVDRPKHIYVSKKKDTKETEHTSQKLNILPLRRDTASFVVWDLYIYS